MGEVRLLVAGNARTLDLVLLLTGELLVFLVFSSSSMGNRAIPPLTLVLEGLAGTDDDSSWEATDDPEWKEAWEAFNRSRS